MQWQPDTAFRAGPGLLQRRGSRTRRCRLAGGFPVRGLAGARRPRPRRSGHPLRNAAPPGRPAGLAPVEPPGAAVDGTPGEWWEQLADQARTAVAGADLSRVLDSPRGQRSIAEGLSFPALDLFVHGWDIGKSAGVDLDLPAGAIKFARAVLEPLPAGQVRSPAGFRGREARSSRCHRLAGIHRLDRPGPGLDCLKQRGEGRQPSASDRSARQGHECDE